MANKIKAFKGGFFFYCPGCQFVHVVSTGEVPSWSFNGDGDRPTISPSYLLWIPASDDGRYPSIRCHLYIRDARIEYLPDSTHSLRGQIVDVPDWQDDYFQASARGGNSDP